MGERLAEARARTREPVAVNVFVPGRGPVDPTVYAGYVERLTAWGPARGLPVGEPAYSDDDWEATLELLRRQPVPVVSFTFGCPASEVIRSLQRAGSEVWVTVTTPEEAREAAACGADTLVVQGAEAGGHRASFVDRHQPPLYSLLPLLGLVRAAVPLPLVASGGIATAEALDATLAAGARAAQVGTAFMLAPEAGTSRAHRVALRTAGVTVLTRAFTGRLARGIRNGFIDAHGAGAPLAYPELHYVTAPLRRQAREQDDAELINLWAGESHELAVELPAAEIAHRLTSTPSRQGQS